MRSTREATSILTGVFCISGKTHFRHGTDKGTRDLYKDDDKKVAEVLFPKDVEFVFPEVTKSGDKDDKSLEETAKEEKKMLMRTDRKFAGKHHTVMRRGVSPVFGL